MNDQQPMTVPEMVEKVTAHFMESLSVTDEDVARARAEIAVGALLESDYLEWWGMTEERDPLFVGRVPRRPPARLEVWYL